MTPSTTTRPHASLRRRLRAVVGLLTAGTGMAILLGGLPWLFIAAVGQPVHHVPTFSEAKTFISTGLNAHTVLVLLVLIGWAGWIVLVAETLAEAWWWARRFPALIRDPDGELRRTRVATVNPLRRVTAIALSSTILALTTTRLAAVPALAATADTARPVATVTLQPAASATNTPTADSADHLPDAAPATDTTATPTAPSPGAPTSRSYTVVEGDNLWDIADRLLGDPEAWPRIYAVNTGRLQPDGERLTNPDLIRPGWTLTMPGTPADAPQPPAPPHQEPGQTPTAPAEPTSPDLAPAPSSTPAPPTTSPANPPGAAASPAPTLQAHPPASLSTAAPAPPGRASGPVVSPATHRASPPSGQHGIEFPDQVFVAVAFVGAIGTALLWWRLHRRRVATARWPSPDEPDEKPLAPTIRRARRHQLTPVPDDPADDDGTAPTDGAGDADVPRSGLDHLSLGSAPDGDALPLLRVLRDGLGLVGPAAPAVGRAVLASLLLVTDAGIAPPRILITDDALRTLFPDAANRLLIDDEPLSRIERSRSLAAALDDLEADISHRQRITDAHGVTTAAALRASMPDDELPLRCLLACADSNEAERLQAVARLGQPLNVVVVAIGLMPEGMNCTVEAGGHVSRADGPNAHHLNGSRLFNVPEHVALDLIDLADGAHGHVTDDRPGTPAPPPQLPGERSPAPDPPASLDPLPPLPSLLPWPRFDEHTDSPQPEEANEPHRPEPEAKTEPEPEPQPDRAVYIRLFDTLPRVEVGDEPVTSGLRTKSKELLAFLTIHPSASTDQIADALWPDQPTTSGHTNLHAAIRSARTTLRQRTGLSSEMFILFADGQYSIDRSVINTDLWDFQRALRQAEADISSPPSLSPLVTAVETYTGPLAAGASYEWVEPHRESLRRRAVDAYSRLASLVENNDPLRALAILDQALNQDPHNEELYQRVMALQARLGQIDAVRRTFRILEQRLAQIDADISAATEAFAEHIFKTSARV